MHLKIEWDPAKAKSNYRKHGTRFADVEVAFYDDHALSMPDEFSVGEDKYVLVGLDALGRSVTVCYAYRGANIRIISARPATKAERKQYEKELRL